MTNEVKNVPELRFPGFEGEWLSYVLKDVKDPKDKYSFTGGPFGSDLKKSDYKDNGIRIIQLQNINDGNFNDNYKIYTSSEKANILKSCNIYPGDIVIAKMADPLARATILPQNKENRYLMASDAIRLKVDDKKFNKIFMVNYINSRRFRRQAEDNSSGSTRMRIGLVTLGQLKISSPNKKEQDIIGDFFSKLDLQIELEEQKLEKLEQQKKGYMQKIFSQQLRFKDENGNQYPDWEEDELKNLGETFSGLSGKTKDDFGHGNAEFITYMNVFKNIIANENMTEKVYISNNERQSNVQYNDILFTTSSEVPNEVGMSSIWLYNKKNVYLNSFCFGFRVLDNRINPVFLTRFLRSDNMRKIITILAQGSTRFNISKKEIMKLPIKIPLLNEQNKINDFLLTIEKAVNTQSEKINKLKTRKKALLQKMFV